MYALSTFFSKHLSGKRGAARVYYGSGGARVYISRCRLPPDVKIIEYKTCRMELGWEHDAHIICFLGFGEKMFTMKRRDQSGHKRFPTRSTGSLRRRPSSFAQFTRKPAHK